MKKIIFVLVLSFIIGALSQSAFASSASVVDLGSAGNFVILSKTGISTTGATKVVGDIGVSPAEATYITGFGLILPTDSAFATSSLITGKVYAPSYANPTPSNMSTAISDMQNAYTDVQGRAASVTELGAGNIGGLTLVPGVYKWGTGVTIPTDVTLNGSANDIWIFQIAQNLDISSSKSIILSGGAKASNVYWAVAGQTTIGTGATFNGTILDKTAIVLNTGAVLNGRALAQTAVTLDNARVTITSLNNESNNVALVSSSNPISPSDSSVISNEGNSNFAIVTHNAPTIPSLNSNNEVNNNVSVNNTPQSYKFGLVTLKFWSRGEAVMELQRFLNEELNINLVIDGKLGPKTIVAVKQYQKENNLVVDGIVGNLTKSKMYENK